MPLFKPLPEPKHLWGGAGSSCARFSWVTSTWGAPDVTATGPGCVCREQAHLPRQKSSPSPPTGSCWAGADTICCCRTLLSAGECFSRALRTLTDLDCLEQPHLGSSPTPLLLFSSSGTVAVASTPSVSCAVVSPFFSCPSLPNGVSEFTLDLVCYCISSDGHWMATRAHHYSQPSPVWMLWHCTLTGKIAAWSTSAPGLSALVEQLFLLFLPEMSISCFPIAFTVGRRECLTSLAEHKVLSLNCKEHIRCKWVCHTCSRVLVESLCWFAT